MSGRMKHITEDMNTESREVGYQGSNQVTGKVSVRDDRSAIQATVP